MLLHPPNGTLSDFRGKLIRFVHGSIFSSVGASTKPGAIQIRLRHANANQINAHEANEANEANEIILLNSHDETSRYQLLAGMFRFVCQNGLVCSETVADAHVPHKCDASGQVIEGAYEVLHCFDRALESRESMQAITLDAGESEVFARAALALE